MERNYREKNRYYNSNYNEYQGHRDVYPRKNYKDGRYRNDFRRNDYNRDYNERGNYSYKGKYYNKYKERNRDNYNNKRYDDDYNYYDDYDYERNYKKHSRSNSKERDIDYIENEKIYKYKNKEYKRRRSRENSRKRSSSSESIKRRDTDKEKEKEPFVSAFTNFPFQLPEEITKNENYQNVSKLYNDINPQNNINISTTNNMINPQLNSNPNLPQIIRNPMINDSQFSLYSNPYLVQSLALLPTAQNTDKKLYIGNLPSGMTPPSLIKMLNLTLQTLKPDDFSKEQPVIGAWVSPDGHYAFVEFRTAEEATKGFILNGFKIMDVPLKIGRPKTYQGLPQTMEERGPSNTVAAILMKNKENIQVKKYKVVLPTKVLCLNSIIKGLDIEDDEIYNEIKEDIKTECEKYGTVLDVFMPRKDVEDNETPGMGNAYIMFENIEQSKLAKKFLSLKRFNNKLIYIQYIPEENFINKNFEPIL
jgi:hypothetical protein